MSGRVILVSDHVPCSCCGAVKPTATPLAVFDPVCLDCLRQIQRWVETVHRENLDLITTLELHLAQKTG